MPRRSDALWAIVPAAGSGQRMQIDTPKQYMPIAGVPMLQRSIDALRQAVPHLQCVVVLAVDDSDWSRLPACQYNRLHTAVGGATRADSVMAGLRFVIEKDDSNPWVLVHDAARPLVSANDIDRLVDAVLPDKAVGGLLAVPAQDTLKLSGDDSPAVIDRTIDRARIWQAQTPQLFKAQTLLNAMESAKREGVPLTDEASAMEHFGEHPVLVEAQHLNFKITRETDRMLAESLLT